MILRRHRLRPAVILALAAGVLARVVPCEAAAGQLESYRYEAIPLGEAGGGRHESIAVEIVTEERDVRYRARMRSADGSLEETEILTDRRAAFVSAEKTIDDGTGKPRRRARIWREGDRVLIATSSEESEPAARHRVPEGKELAVDGSLILQLRSFPSTEPGERSVFMADFSGRTVSVRVHAAGSEPVTTPAGTFECHRIEVIVDIPLLPTAWRPKIVFWLSRAEPHFLVKHVGKRGPFTDTFETVLTAVGTPDGGGRPSEHPR